ncbi:MAG: DegT/DnrJ/EryC1/StrS aminotransferase [Phenylobacterium sp.]|nr:DegT/DnrJ/EryC1/StrS aminotransferase [Phenylobacterium sp.]
MALSRALPLEATPVARATVPVARPRLPAAEAILPYLQRIDEARWYSNFGPLLTEFEARLAERFRPDTQVLTCTNATQALTLALQAMDLPPGGAVIVPSWTFVATAHAVMQAGLVPWFVDVDAATWMLDPAEVMDQAMNLASEVCAVIPVCAFGQLPDLAAWRAFQDESGVPVLIDAAAAFDTIHDARLPVCVSLHATKVLGLGEGGFMATEDAELALRFRKLTTYGFWGSRESLIPATNAKLSEYAAAVGLAALDGWPADRLRFMRAAQLLRIALIGLPQVRFQDGWGSDWVTSVCTVGLPDRSAARVAAALAEDGVDTRQWWGAGCHASQAFAHCHRDELTVTERLAGATLGLPFSVDMDADEIARVTASLQKALAGL